MTNLGNQLNRLLPALSGRERAILVLRNFKAGRPQDKRLGWNMPINEAKEYNRLISLLRTCNTELVTHIVLLTQLIDKLDVRLAWLFSLSMWGEHADVLETYIDLYTKDPVTESEFKALEEKAQQEMVLVPELAEVLVEGYEEWAQDELEDTEACVVKPECWERLVRQKAKELTALVAGGTLEGKGRGSSLRIQRRSFYTWLGQEVPVQPDWGCAYEVFPDDEQPRVEFLRKERKQLRRCFRFSPAGFGPAPDRPAGDESVAPMLRRALEKTVQADLVGHWSELSALEAVLDEIATEFGGEDVLKPALRQDIETAKDKAVTVHRLLQDWTGEFELPAADQGAIEQTRALIALWAKV